MPKGAESPPIDFEVAIADFSVEVNELLLERDDAVGWMEVDEGIAKTTDEVSPFLLVGEEILVRVDVTERRRTTGLLLNGHEFFFVVVSFFSFRSCVQLFRSE